MVTAWYTLVVGILITIDGIVMLIFDIDGFVLPDWYIGLMLLVGVVGIILGLVFVNKKKSEQTTVHTEKETDREITQ